MCSVEGWLSSQTKLGALAAEVGSAVKQRWGPCPHASYSLLSLQAKWGTV